MVRKISSDIIYTNVGQPLRDHAICIDDHGTILSIDPANKWDTSEVSYIPGALVPGFVNAHCHLELSHMKGKLPTGTGLVSFIEGVVSQRDFPKETIMQAIRDANEEMHQNGIVAVGDISNRLDTMPCKDESPIYYHTFVEMFDFQQNDRARSTLEQYLEVYHQMGQTDGHTKSAVPHAPYSVSKNLFALINTLNSEAKTSVSIHNQETPSEDRMFIDGGGAMVDLFSGFGCTFDHLVSGQFQSSLQYAIENLDSTQRTLFVHNTMSALADIRLAEKWSDQCFWVSCPNANLYIENRLPDYHLFVDTGATICLGTDSLTSNWQLSIFEEIKTIRKYYSTIPDEQLIRWSTINGARALGIDDQFGSIKVGSTPGINHLSLNAAMQLDLDSQMIKII